MSQFIRFFGEQIMVLWKLALLRRRILIFSPPPVGVVCYRGGKQVHTHRHVYSIHYVLYVHTHTHFSRYIFMKELTCFSSSSPTLLRPSSTSSLLLLLLLSVYCCCCLANISLPGVSVALPEFRPFFYVNVADISALENELSYVACKWLLEEHIKK